MLVLLRRVAIRRLNRDTPVMRYVATATRLRLYPVVKYEYTSLTLAIDQIFPNDIA